MFNMLPYVQQSDRDWTELYKNLPHKHDFQFYLQMQLWS